MIAKVTYSGSLRTQAIHLSSNDVITTDAPTDNEGLGEAFSPTDLTATSLAACMLTIMGIKARKHGWNIEEATADVTKVMAADPRKISDIIVDIRIPGGDLSSKARQILEKAARTCPVALSIHPDINQEVSFQYL